MAAKRICSVEGCGKPHLCRGFCVMHYARWNRGSPLTKAPSTSRTTIANAYREALASDTDECVIWPLRRNAAGYAVWAKHKRFSALVARHMCRELYGEPPNPSYHAAHSCGNGHLGCVNPRHISWKTPTGNSLDRYKHGTMILGVDMWRAKLDPDKVRAIRKLLAAGLSNADIGDQFDVTGSTIWAIKTGRTWVHVV